MPFEPYEHLYDGVLSHSFAYVGFAFMTGHATWRAVIGEPKALMPYEAAFFRGGAALALVGVLANLRHTTLAMTDELTVSNVRDVLSYTLFGHGLLLYAACLALTIFTWALLQRRTGAGQVPWLWLPAGGALLFHGLLGHASAEGWWSWLGLLFWLHISAVVAWLGGLMVWVALLSRGYAAMMVSPLQAFSRFAAAAMGLVLPTGALIALYHIPQPAAMLSVYGVTLGVKVVLVGAVLGIALMHRLRRLPRLARRPYDLQGWQRLDTWLSVEAVLAIATLMIAAGLSQVPPPEALDKQTDIRVQPRHRDAAGRG